MPVWAQAEVARDDGLGLEDLGALVLRDEVGEAPATCPGSRVRWVRERGAGDWDWDAARSTPRVCRGTVAEVSIDWLMSKALFRGAG